jgi:hypothetical protein
MKHPVEQVGWLIIGLLLGGLLAISVNALATDPTVISSTVSSTSSSNTVSSGTTTVDKTPSTASSPSISITNSDICKSAGFSGAIQTQVLGISTGGVVVRDEHCEKLKMARAFNAVGLKTVAAGVLAQDPVAFKAMWMSGVYPPISGKLGDEARQIWMANPEMLPGGLTLTDLMPQGEYLAYKEEIARETAAEEAERAYAEAQAKLQPWERDGYVGTCEKWTGESYQPC